MTNKYGNDFKNNIMWNKEYPFIPEITRSDGVTFHEGDNITDIARDGQLYKGFYRGVIGKIFDENTIYVYCNTDAGPCSWCAKIDQIEPYYGTEGLVKMPDWDNSIFNIFSWILDGAYLRLYGDEILENEDMYEAQRLADVKRIKEKYQK